NDLYCIAQSYKQYGEYYLRAQKLDTSGNILWGDEGLQICYSDQLMPVLRTSIFTDRIDILYHCYGQGVFLQKIDAEGNLGFGDHGILTPASYIAQLTKYANNSYSYFWFDTDIPQGSRLMHMYINSGGSFQESQVLSTVNIFDIYPINCDNSTAIYWNQNNTDFLSIEETGIGHSIYATALPEPIANADITQELMPMVSLRQNTPNPFTGSTRISYKLREACPVKLQIFNIKGQLVQELAAMPKAAGEYSWDWDGTDLRGQKCAGGIYLYKINAATHSVSKKMVLLK
ncbi:MAG: FlgD immunoglobulin-like domain containing protein, partial [Candidatus Cloacimonetes bacterium]|nr:FlgD immunoglobulin-like domain containing protein [Candidatus Cloacimonadota bacterium]